MVTIAGIDLEKPIVSTCLTGMSATIVAGTLLILGKEVPVYYVRLLNFYLGYLKRKSAFEHAQNAHSDYPAHAQSIIGAFALHKYIL